jgi:hypothetical protein
MPVKAVCWKLQGSCRMETKGRARKRWERKRMQRQARKKARKKAEKRRRRRRRRRRRVTKMRAVWSYCPCVTGPCPPCTALAVWYSACPTVTWR